MKKVVLFLFVFLLTVPVYANEKKEVTFSKCVDGDTASFILDNEEIKARFLAIDTPETVHPTKGEEPFGKEASNYTCDKLTNAKKIIIEYDDGSSKLDKYKRHLVWVYYDDNFLQEELLEKGYAKVAYLYGNYAYTDELKKVEEKAKEEKIGIWNNYVEVIPSKEYTVTFVYDKTKKKVKVDEGSVVNPISNPKKDKYKFLGWYLNDEIYDFSLPVNDDLTLTAKFELIEEDVPFYMYVLAIVVFIFVISTNYKGSRKKLKRKLKRELLKK